MSCKIENKMKRNAKTKVALNTNPSNPLLEKAVSEPQTLPKPTPLT